MVHRSSFSNSAHRSAFRGKNDQISQEKRKMHKPEIWRGFRGSKNLITVFIVWDDEAHGRASSALPGISLRFPNNLQSIWDAPGGQIPANSATVSIASKSRRKLQENVTFFRQRAPPRDKQHWNFLSRPNLESWKFASKRGLSEPHVS
jgi:hypothetical protein